MDNHGDALIDIGISFRRIYSEIFLYVRLASCFVHIVSPY